MWVWLCEIIGQRILTKKRITFLSPFVAADEFVWSWPHLMHGSLCPCKSVSPNSISISWASFVYAAAMALHCFHWGGQPQNCLIPLEFLTLSNTWFLVPTRVSPEMASPFLQGSQTANRHTDRPLYSVYSSIPYLVQCIWCSIKTFKINNVA